MVSPLPVACGCCCHCSLNGLAVLGKAGVDAPSGLNCGDDDDFLCIPDRLPWLIRYD